MRALQRVAALTEVIRTGGDRAQELRRLAPETVDALGDAGMPNFSASGFFAGLVSTPMMRFAPTRRAP